MDFVISLSLSLTSIVLLYLLIEISVYWSFIYPLLFLSFFSITCAFYLSSCLSVYRSIYRSVVSVSWSVNLTFFLHRSVSLFLTLSLYILLSVCSVCMGIQCLCMYVYLCALLMSCVLLMAYFTAVRITSTVNGALIRMESEERY